MTTKKICTSLLFGALLLSGCAHMGQGEVPIEVAATFPYPPGNLAVSVDGRIFASYHVLFSPPIRVVEARKDGSVVPYPNAAWNGDPKKEKNVLVSVLSVRADANGILWMLDNGGRKLVAWDTRKEQLSRVIPFDESVAPKSAFLNDFAVDLTNQAVYIIDTGDITNGQLAALLVVDLKTGKTRRVLHNHASVNGETKRPLAVKGKESLVPTGNKDNPFFKPVVGGDPIALNQKNDWLFYGAMSSDTMYKIRTADLRNAELNPAALAQRVQRHGDKKYTDGITVDNAGNVYTSDIEENAIGVISPDGKHRTWVQSDEKLPWVDGFSFGPDGMLYVTISQIHRSPVLNAGKNEAVPPFVIVKLKPLAPGVPGR